MEQVSSMGNAVNLGDSDDPIGRGPAMQDVTYPSSSGLLAGDEPGGSEVAALRQAHRSVVSVHDELDVAAAAVLQRQLLALLQLSLACLARDLREVSFMDSAGLSILVRVGDRARDDGVKFDLVDPSPEVEWMLYLTGLTPLSTPAR
jgi:anti-anti-sigma factor